MSATADSEDEVLRLLRKRVPEIASGAVQIRGFARESGRLCMICVSTSASDCDPIALCLPVVRDIVRSSGERIELIRWSESPDRLIRQVLAPAHTKQIILDPSTHRAIIVLEGQTPATLSADDGLRMRLASRLTGWELALAQA